MPRQIDIDKCSVCCICKPACPVDAIEDAGNKLQINANECVDCGTCWRICPEKCIDGGPDQYLELRNE